MKLHTTQRDIKDAYVHVISVPYCALQHLLIRESPIAYTDQREGWGADIYNVDGSTAIATGYAPFGDIKPAHAICSAYEKKALKVISDTKPSDVHWQLRQLLLDFVREVC